jgi:HK97 family phage prohead protease/HK97 family phage major capsid protein
MEKIFNLTSTFKAFEEDDGGVHICGMASTSDFDRAGDTIDAGAWTKGGLNNFEKNPIILFNHDYNKPIGRATGLKVTENGLELKAKISKSAPDHVAQLVKEGILGAFSVGFRVKDADYLEETDGLKIKDAELFEVSVVSVPCNQAATFSLSKSFDSLEEYEDFKKTFKNSVDLAGQSLAKDENSSVASDTPDGVTKAQKETKMSEVQTPEIDLDAFAKKVAEETAAKIAMKQAEEKAVAEAARKEVEEAEMAKTAKEEEVQSAIKVGVESGAERLMADLQKEFEAKNADTTEILNKYKTDLEEKSAELEAMRTSKRDFTGRKAPGDLKPMAKDLLSAHILGKITRKGWETDFGRDLLEKAEVTYTATTSAGIDVIVSTQFEEEVRQAQKIAPLFREINVTSGATVLPIAPDTEPANWAATGADVAANNLEEAGASDNNYNVNQVILQAHRLISSTFITNDTDEQIVLSVLPMITSALARAHAVAIDKAILVGNSGGYATGLVGASGTDDTNGFATASAQTALDASTTAEVTPANLLAMRKEMGKYGLEASQVAYIVPTDAYYELIDASGFTDVTEVGSDLATKLSGMVGTVFGSPVVATDQLAQNLGAAGAATTTAALAVYMPNYVTPRLRGVNVETDYIVKEQRTVLVATQALGFNELVANSGTNKPSIRWPFQ